MEVFVFTCSFQFNNSDGADIGNTNVGDKNINVNIVNLTNYDLLGFENASKFFDMEDIDKDEDSPLEELDLQVSLDLNKFCLTCLFATIINIG